MSDTVAPAADPTLIEQNGDVPDTVTPGNAKEVVADESTEDAPETENPEAEAAAQPEAPKRKPWYQVRIDEITAARRDEERKRVAAEEKLKTFENAAPIEEQPKFTQEEFQKAVEAEASRRANQMEVNKRTKGWLDAGEKEYGKDGFTDKCNIVAAIGAGDNPAFMQIVTDSDILPDGHKVVAMLADNPDEAQRILSLEPMKMAAALTRFATTVKAPDPQVSKAPKPIQTTGGTAKNGAPTDSETIEEWMAKRKAQVAQRAGR